MSILRNGGAPFIYAASCVYPTYTAPARPRSSARLAPASLPHACHIPQEKTTADRICHPIPLLDKQFLREHQRKVGSPGTPETLILNVTCSFHYGLCQGPCSSITDINPLFWTVLKKTTDSPPLSRRRCDVGLVIAHLDLVFRFPAAPQAITNTSTAYHIQYSSCSIPPGSQVVSTCHRHF